MVVWKLSPDASNSIGVRAWLLELLFAIPIVALVIYLFYTWFALLDRYFIFLYYHDMGPRFDTTPFGWVTVSRYWMSGLVASGAVMVPYMGLNLVLGRLVKAFRAPHWQRLWLLCAVPLLIAIPAIVMTVNDPVLPLVNAVQVTAATLIGLALAVMLGRLAAERPLTYLLLLVDGFALTCLLVALPGLEDMARWLAQGSTGAIATLLVVAAASVLQLIITTAAYALWRPRRIPRASTWLVAGLNITYLFLPLYHHLFWSKDEGSWTDPDYYCYISDADNYFARSVPYQIAVWVAVALIALAVTRLRRWLAARRTASHSIS